ELTKIINDKKFLNVVCIALVLAFLLLAISFLTTTRKKTNTSLSVNSEGTINGNTDEISNERNNIIQNYEDQQKSELKSLLRKIEGVGEVEVMIYFKSGEIKVPATEDTTTQSFTEESDSQGGKRTNNQQTDGTKVVMAGDGSSSEPYILQVNKPEISGVVIVAEGATSSKVKYDIQVAVSSLYDISIDKVNVYPMKE
ncbi:MAG: stage III sporulation protein AG, partial [Clostridiales bacterium]|nr:stage III sporulation protein AG [Clostridiales bacterium]